MARRCTYKFSYCREGNRSFNENVNFEIWNFISVWNPIIEKIVHQNTFSDFYDLLGDMLLHHPWHPSSKNGQVEK